MTLLLGASRRSRRARAAVSDSFDDALSDIIDRLPDRDLARQVLRDQARFPAVGELTLLATVALRIRCVPVPEPERLWAARVHTTLLCRLLSAGGADATGLATALLPIRLLTRGWTERGVRLTAALTWVLTFATALFPHVHH